MHHFHGLLKYYTDNAMDQGGYYFLKSAIVLEVAGLHASRYLHNRLTNDIKAMSVGENRFAAALTPTGKVEGLFSLFRAADQKYILICSGGDREAVIPALKRYVVADRLTVQDASDEIILLHVFSESPIDLRAHAWEGVQFKNQRVEIPGFDILIRSDDREVLVAKLNESGLIQQSDTQFLLSRIRACKPQFPDEINERTLLPETGPADAIAFGKGCYVGQEVMEKIDAYGRTARKLARVRFSGDLQNLVSVDILDVVDKAPIGKILSSAYDETRKETETLSLVRATHIRAGTKVAIATGAAEGEVIT